MAVLGYTPFCYGRYPAMKYSCDTRPLGFMAETAVQNTAKMAIVGVPLGSTTSTTIPISMLTIGI